MIDLVDDILNTSRIDMGTLVIDPKAVDLIDLFNSILKEMEPLIIKKGMEIRKEYDEKIPQINADPELIILEERRRMGRAWAFISLAR